jgi:hypothetical protein
MKRQLIERALRKAGLEIREGGNHSKVYRDGVFISALPRHSEINDMLVKAIEKQTGIALK